MGGRRLRERGHAGRPWVVGDVVADEAAARGEGERAPPPLEGGHGTAVGVNVSADTSAWTSMGDGSVDEAEAAAGRGEREPPPQTRPQD